LKTNLLQTGPSTNKQGNFILRPWDWNLYEKKKPSEIDLGNLPYFKRWGFVKKEYFLEREERDEDGKKKWKAHAKKSPKNM